MDAHNRGDYATALDEWRPLAEQGDALAQYNLGVRIAKAEVYSRTMSKHGSGMPKRQHRGRPRRSSIWGRCILTERVLRKTINRPCDGSVWPQTKERRLLKRKLPSCTMMAKGCRRILSKRISGTAWRQRTEISQRQNFVMRSPNR